MKKVKKIYSAFTLVFVVAIFALAILLVGVRLFGLTPYTVLSGSMEPKIHVGSLIYVVDVDPADLQVGDTLTFKHSGNTVTHEIVEIIEAENPQDRLFVTQGLTNNITDGQIPVSDIIGKPVFTIPYLGYVAVYIQNPVGIISTACALVIILMLSFLFEMLPDKAKDAAASDQPSVLSESSDDPAKDSDDNIETLKNPNKEEKQ